MNINTKESLVGYPTFLKKVESLKAFSDGNFSCVNMTEKECPGWTENLYEASTLGCWVSYSQTREWTYHDNGVEGKGLTLEIALSNWGVAYDKYLSSI